MSGLAHLCMRAASAAVFSDGMCRCGSTSRILERSLLATPPPTFGMAGMERFMCSFGSHGFELATAYRAMPSSREMAYEQPDESEFIAAVAPIRE